jgi:murein L,D-transpeptidase YafK
MTASATSPTSFHLRVWASLGLLLLATAGGGAATTAERVASYGASFTLIGLKAEKRLELWAPDAAGRPRLIKTYPILAASGGAGPKLREGDRQVPEGLYAIESLNPNSRFHLSLRIDYPNAADRRRAQAEARTGLGGDIMIHGSNVSIGCLAMGDPAAE